MIFTLTCTTVAQEYSHYHTVHVQCDRDVLYLCILIESKLLLITPPPNKKQKTKTKKNRLVKSYQLYYENVQVYSAWLLKKQSIIDPQKIIFLKIHTFTCSDFLKS